MVKVQRGRAWGGFLALGGVVLAVPSVIWPTLRLTEEPVGVPSEFRGPAFVQNVWSWGRYSFEGVGAPAQTVTNVLGLAFVVAMLTGGLVAAVLWLTQRGSAARLLGVAGAAVALAEVAHSALQRLGQLWAGFYGGEFGPTAHTTTAGVLEYLAGVVLAAALVVMLWRPALAVSRPLWREMSVRARIARERDEGATALTQQERAGGVTVLGDTVLRDAGLLRRGESGPDLGPEQVPAAGSEPAGEERAVGFSDPPGDDDGFLPPRRP